jgi:hypothetical protein
VQSLHGDGLHRINALVGLCIMFDMSRLLSG